MYKKVSAAGTAYATVREDILAGRLSGGTLLSEGEVAERLGMSRTPVREAFQRLETEGWLSLYPRRGAVVVPVADTEPDDVIHARFLVEVASVAAIVAASATGHTPSGQSIAEFLRKLDDRIAEQEAALRPAENAQAIDAAEAADAFTHADAAFHRDIVAAAGNSVLTRFSEALRDRQRRMTLTALHRVPGQRDLVIEEHRALAASATTDPQRFATVLWEHMRRTHHLPPAPPPPFPATPDRAFPDPVREAHA